MNIQYTIIESVSLFGATMECVLPHHLSTEQLNSTNTVFLSNVIALLRKETLIKKCFFFLLLNERYQFGYIIDLKNMKH